MANSLIQAAPFGLMVDNNGVPIGIDRGAREVAYFPRLIGCSAVPVSHTGDTTDAELARCVIPGGIMGPNGILRLNVLFTVTGSTNGKNLHARIGSVDILSGHFINSAGNVGAYHDRVLWNRGSQNSQVVMNSWGGAGTTSAAAATGTVDMSEDQTLIISGQLALATETITLEAWSVVVTPRY